MSLRLHSVQSHIGPIDPGARPIDPHADVRIADFHAVGMVGTLTTPDSRIDGIIDSQVGVRRMTRTMVMTTMKTRQQSMTRKESAGCCS